MRVPGRVPRPTSSHPIRGDEDLTSLALRARDGDRAAEEALVARTIDDVHRYCAHLLGHRLADDATQATYLRALRSLATYRGESSVRTWLIGVARNTCLDERRSMARRHRLVERITAQPIDTFDPGHQTTESVDVGGLVDLLTPERREAFVLTQVLGFSYEDAALLADCPVGTIRSRVARARAELLRVIEAADRIDSFSA